jgi:hypothetical protein
MSYKELLTDPRWQKKRLQVLERDGWQCTNCGDQKKTLHVHHNHYEFGMAPWEYPEKSLAAVCKDCHSTIENQRKRMLSIIKMVGYEDYVYITGIIAAYLAEKGNVISGLTLEELTEGSAMYLGCRGEDVADCLGDGVGGGSYLLDEVLAGVLRGKARNGHP